MLRHAGATVKDVHQAQPTISLQVSLVFTMSQSERVALPQLKAPGG
jgi:hypothetical protein